jgi:hypothetical protein
MFKSKTNLLPWHAGLDEILPRGKEGWAMPANDWMETVHERQQGEPESQMQNRVGDY